eukprot:1546260-Pleurochrysis_carterae.AAC.3
MCNSGRLTPTAASREHIMQRKVCYSWLVWCVPHEGSRMQYGAEGAAGLSKPAAANACSGAPQRSGDTGEGVVVPASRGSGNGC